MTAATALKLLVLVLNVENKHLTGTDTAGNDKSTLYQVVLSFWYIPLGGEKNKHT